MTTAPTVIRDSQVILRERSFPISQDVMIFVRAIQDRLGISRATGMLCIDLNQGGVGTVRFREEQEIQK